MMSSTTYWSLAVQKAYSFRVHQTYRLMRLQKNCFVISYVYFFRFFISVVKPIQTNNKNNEKQTNKK